MKKGKPQNVIEESFPLLSSRKILEKIKIHFNYILIVFTRLSHNRI